MNRSQKIALAIIAPVIILGVIIDFLFSPDEASSWETPWQETVIEGTGDQKVVQLFVEGTIQSQTEDFGSYSMVDTLKKQLDQIQDDEQVGAIVLRIDSPGGEVVATDELYGKLMQIKQAKDIPIIVSMGSMAASGGYYLATAGDTVFANRNTLTGSLGVIFTLLNYGDAANRYGIKEYVIKSGKYKDIGNAFRPLTKDERDIFQSLVNESYQNFVDVIVKGRDLPREKVLKIADGRIYSGEQAKKLGLIDEFGDLDDATDRAVELLGGEATVVRYEEDFSFENLLLGAQKTLKRTRNPLGMDTLLGRGATPKLLYQFRP
ncbi:signal peptide peptidase SppA [Brevibacillus dissolubilis]|uniref:signal peptide peptidase SppA n=1 Tax=Brevibacillus dissolubilis TaxID=1844116 RepID=UPI001116B2FD|nr:signal peptide peptidase SppA [Brevibacillus dissolubilis]